MTNRRGDGTRADQHAELRAAVRAVCEPFGDEYWRELDARREYPEAFVEAMTTAGYLAALIPEEYGGMGLRIDEASVILEEINRSGGNAQPAHAQVYTMGTLLRHGSEEQRREYLPRIASGEIRLQAFGVTEPEAGTDTTSLRTTAERQGDRYVVNGTKMFISRVQYSDYMVLLARTTPREEVKRRSDGLSVFLVDLREAIGHGLTVKPRRVMINNVTNELVFEELSIPASSLIGVEGEGFRYILDGMNAERILIAGECIGNGRWFVDRATARAREREVFGRPIGKNQGIQFPLARAHIGVEAADLMRFRAASLFDA
ncbi:MAG: acyl-CoA dehydrogenase, partial [Solirubrobacteraceae bacterium]|nr:acyl-CoA dehydrogenase [Solirubrobacteraceae bacterium]